MYLPYRAGKYSRQLDVLVSCTYIVSSTYSGQSPQPIATVDWEYFVGSNLAWEKRLTRFNFVNLACVRNYFNLEILIHVFML